MRIGTERESAIPRPHSRCRAKSLSFPYTRRVRTLFATLVCTVGYSFGIDSVSDHDRAPWLSILGLQVREHTSAPDGTWLPERTSRREKNRWLTTGRAGCSALAMSYWGLIYVSSTAPARNSQTRLYPTSPREYDTTSSAYGWRPIHPVWKEPKHGSSRRRRISTVISVWSRLRYGITTSGICGADTSMRTGYSAN